MDTSKLSEQHCSAPAPDARALEMDDAVARLERLNAETTGGWDLHEHTKSVSKEFTFKNFAEAFRFASRIAEIAETERHHPGLYIGWGMVRVDLSSHSLGGLSENDFILAAKIDNAAAMG